MTAKECRSKTTPALLPHVCAYSMFNKQTRIQSHIHMRCGPAKASLSCSAVLHAPVVASPVASTEDVTKVVQHGITRVGLIGLQGRQ